jgi:hypothetical protein
MRQASAFGVYVPIIKQSSASSYGQYHNGGICDDLNGQKKKIGPYLFAYCQGWHFPE